MSASSGGDSLDRLVSRLSGQSVTRRSRAFGSIPWDAHVLDPFDERWQLDGLDPLCDTAWYREQPTRRKAELGFRRTCINFAVGIEFEAVLQRGLLSYASLLRHGSPLFRYCYHEVVEEGEHSLMFGEFLRLAEFDIPVADPAYASANETLLRLAIEFPSLFFVCILAGELPIDYIQRRLVSRGTHPLLDAICRTHISEEARHVAFAAEWLTATVPQLTEREIRRLQMQAPFAVRELVRRVVVPSDRFQDSLGIPGDVFAEAYGEAASRTLVRAATRKLVATCESAGVVGERFRPVWDNL